MEAVTIMPTEALEQLMQKIDTLNATVVKLAKTASATDPVLTLKEAAGYLKKSYLWTFQNKHKIGCSNVGGSWLIRQSSLDAYINSTYHKDK